MFKQSEKGLKSKILDLNRLFILPLSDELAWASWRTYHGTVVKTDRPAKEIASVIRIIPISVAGNIKQKPNCV